MKSIIADRAAKIDASGIRKVFALAASMKDPVNFSIGQPDFDVPEQLKDEAIKAIKRGHNKYTQTAGDAELIEKIALQIKKEFGWDEPAVMVTSGVSGGLLLLFLAMINPGDEVIISDPYFVIYKQLVNMLGGKCIFIDSYPNFALPVARIADAITDRTKLLILNTPCNPTGIVYSQQEIKELAGVAGRKGIAVLVDEIYQMFSYDGHCPSLAQYYDRAIVLRGFGKSYAMTGWRLGYVAVHQVMKELIEQMTKIQQYTFVCAPAPFQRAALAALDYDISDLIDTYKRKRDLLCSGLSDKFEFIKPGGAFYAFIKAPDGSTASQFVEKAIANNVLIIPGNVFSEKDTHFRLSYATSDEKIRQGINILRSLT